MEEQARVDHNKIKVRWTQITREYTLIANGLNLLDV